MMVSQICTSLTDFCPVTIYQICPSLSDLSGVYSGVKYPTSVGKKLLSEWIRYTSSPAEKEPSTTFT